MKLYSTTWKRNISKQYTSAKTYFASKLSLFSILPWIESGFWKITYYIRSTFSSHQNYKKATIHEIIASWHQVLPVHMVRPDDMQQSNHPHTFTAGCTPKLGQSLRQYQHQKHGNCFSFGNTPVLEFPNVNYLFDLKQHQPPRKYLNTEVTTLTGLITSYYHGTRVNTSKPSSAFKEGLAPPRQKMYTMHCQSETIKPISSDFVMQGPWEFCQKIYPIAKYRPWTLNVEVITPPQPVFQGACVSPKYLILIRNTSLRILWTCK